MAGHRLSKLGVGVWGERHLPAKCSTEAQGCLAPSRAREGHRGTPGPEEGKTVSPALPPSLLPSQQAAATTITTQKQGGDVGR